MMELGAFSNSGELGGMDEVQHAAGDVLWPGLAVLLLPSFSSPSSSFSLLLSFSPSLLSLSLVANVNERMGRGEGLLVGVSV